MFTSQKLLQMANFMVIFYSVNDAKKGGVSGKLLSGIIELFSFLIGYLSYLLGVLEQTHTKFYRKFPNMKLVAKLFAKSLIFVMQFVMLLTRKIFYHLIVYLFFVNLEKMTVRCTLHNDSSLFSMYENGLVLKEVVSTCKVASFFDSSVESKVSLKGKTSRISVLNFFYTLSFFCQLSHFCNSFN